MAVRIADLAAGQQAPGAMDREQERFILLLVDLHQAMAERGPPGARRLRRPMREAQRQAAVAIENGLHRRAGARLHEQNMMFQHAAFLMWRSCGAPRPIDSPAIMT
jgi:hypothetical protein